MEFLSCLFLALSCLLPTVISCSCPIEVTSSTRSEAICSFYSSESFIYAATVTSAYCKCTPSTSTINHRQFSCINFRSDLQGNVTGNVEETYRCPAGDLTIQVVYYDICNSTIRNAGTTTPSSVPMTTSPIKNITCSNFPMMDEVGGCSLTQQPCYYTVTVDAVYKGDTYQVGQSFNTSGPDVLTSCGQYGRILTVGSSYIAGIGGPCVPISEWDSVDAYSASEIQLLQSLANDTATEDICRSASKGTKLLISTSILLYLLLIVTSV